MTRPDETKLYQGDFEGFVARRDALARKLREGGDGEAADRVRALKKPSRVAWALNQLSGKPRKQLLDAGAALRKAQERLVAGKGDRADLRTAAEREQAAVANALEAVGKAGAKLSAAAEEKARQTLHAVALDEAVREEFEAGRLVTEHEVAGLGGLTLGTGRAPAKKPAADRRRRERLKAAEAKARELEERHEAAEREAKAARTAAEEAKRDLDRATRGVDRAAKEAAAARAKADELRER